MMSEALLSESKVLEQLRQLPEARGLKFYADPPRKPVANSFRSGAAKGKWRTGSNAASIVAMKRDAITSDAPVAI